MGNWRDNNVEFILKQDSREKKRTGIGVYKRASRRGYCRGGVRTQSDFLSAKEKKSLNGEVRVYSMYNDLKNLPSIEELRVMMKEKPEKAKIILTETKKNFTQKQLCTFWGLSNGAMYHYYDKLGVDYKKKGQARKDKGTKKSKPVSKKFYTENRIGLLEYLEKMNITKDEFNYVRKINDLPEYFQAFRMLPDFQTRLVDLIAKYTIIELSLLLNCTDKQISGVAYRCGLKCKRATPLSSILIKEIMEYRKNNKSETQMEFEEIKEDMPQIEATTPQEVIDNTQDIIDIKEQLKALQEILERSTSKEEKVIEQGFKISLNGQYEKSEIENKLLSIAGILVDNKKYRLELNLVEIN